MFSNWLSKSIKEKEAKSQSFISASLPVVPDLAVDALLNEGENLLTKTLDFLVHILSLDRKGSEYGGLRSLVSARVSANAMYDRLKQTEGAILEYYTTVQTSELVANQYDLVNQYIAATRYCIRAAKTMKDIHHDLKDFESTGNDILYMQYQNLQKDWSDFNLEFHNLLDIQNQGALFGELASIMKSAFLSQQRQTSEIIEILRKKKLDELEISTLLNVHHEILSVKKSLLRALAHLKLTVTQSEEFEFIPEG
jgi:phosphate:Na+ symporter